MTKVQKARRVRSVFRVLILITPCLLAWVMLFDRSYGVPGILTVITVVTALVLLLDAAVVKRVLTAPVRLFLLIMISFGFAFSLYERPTILLHNWNDGTGFGETSYYNGTIHYRRMTWAVSPWQGQQLEDPSPRDIGAAQKIFGLPQTLVRQIEEPIGTTLEVQVPAWLPLTILGTLLVLFSRPWKKLHSPLHCSSCSYCMIGNESGVCPECGTPIPEKQKQAIAKGTTTP